MTRIEIMRYVLTHHHEQTMQEMATACGVRYGKIEKTCSSLRIKAITSVDRKITVIIAADGTKTADQLAEIAGCKPNAIREICRAHNLPLLSLQNASDDPETWSPERMKYELDKEIKFYTDQGHSRMEAIEILSMIADYLINIRDPEEKVERPKGVYSNPSREQLIEKVLNPPSP
jgi:hypothetical protein